MARPVTYIEIEFKRFRRHIFSNPEEYPFKVGDYAVVQVKRGIDLGKITNISERVKPQENAQVYPILRKANPDEIRKIADIRSRELQALIDTRVLVGKRELVMKVVDVEFQFDFKKLTIYFTAPKRVDFRELLKDLIAAFKIRIELRHIDAKREALRFGTLKDPDVLYLDSKHYRASARKRKIAGL